MRTRDTSKRLVPIELAALARSLSQQPSSRSLPLQGSSSSHERPSEPDYTGRQAGVSASR